MGNNIFYNPEVFSQEALIYEDFSDLNVKKEVVNQSLKCSMME